VHRATLAAVLGPPQTDFVMKHRQQVLGHVEQKRFTADVTLNLTSCLFPLGLR
jgi:hypothetical protein